MTVTTVSSREFNQDTGRAKIAARSGPVFITDRGRPAHVLQSGEPVDSRLQVIAHQSLTDFVFGVGIFNPRGAASSGWMRCGSRPSILVS